MNDDFSSIVTGVEEGRKIFDNMKKTVAYILAGNSCELFPFFVYVIFGIPISITPIMMMCVSLGTDLVPAISLIYEKDESDIMNIPPRNPRKDRLVTSSLLRWVYLQTGIIVTCSGYAGFFMTMMRNGWKPHEFLQMRETWTIEGDLADSYGNMWVCLDFQISLLKLKNKSKFSL